MMTVKTRYYQQFDADNSLDVPAEGYGGWQEADLPLEPEHTALVVMHAWDCGTRVAYPGWYRAVEYIPRADGICLEVFPGLLGVVRQSEMPIFHVVGGGSYYLDYPGYKRAKALAEEACRPAPVGNDTPVLEKLRRFRREKVFPGSHNEEDIQRGFDNRDFHPQAMPVGEEGIAEDGTQLAALCRHSGVNHLIYTGFAINWCLLLSPGGMAEMSQYGLLCSAVEQAVTAVENKESGRNEWGKKMGLWRVALAFGFVYDMDDLLNAFTEHIGAGVG